MTLSDFVLVVIVVAPATQAGELVHRRSTTKFTPFVDAIRKARQRGSGEDRV